MFQFFINRNWSPLRHISENNSVQFKIHWPLKASLNGGSEVIGSEHLCIHYPWYNILNFYQSDWHSMLLDLFWRIHLRIAYYACIGTEMPEKGSSQRRSSPTCVEGGGCCASVLTTSCWSLCGSEAGPVSGLRHPHTTSWWEDARPRGQSTAASSSQLSNTLQPSERRSAGEARGELWTHIAQTLC